MVKSKLVVVLSNSTAPDMQLRRVQVCFTCSSLRVMPNRLDVWLTKNPHSDSAQELGVEGEIAIITKDGRNRFVLPASTHAQYPDCAATYEYLQVFSELQDDSCEPPPGWIPSTIDMPGAFKAAEIATFREAGLMPTEPTPPVSPVSEPEAPSWSDIVNDINEIGPEYLTATLWEGKGPVTCIKVLDKRTGLVFLWGNVNRCWHANVWVDETTLTPFGSGEQSVCQSQLLSSSPTSELHTVICEATSEYLPTQWLRAQAICWHLVNGHKLNATVMGDNNKQTVSVKVVHRGKTFEFIPTKGFFEKRVWFTPHEKCMETRAQVNSQFSLGGGWCDTASPRMQDIAACVAAISEEVKTPMLTPSRLLEMSGFMYRSDAATTVEGAREANAWVSKMENTSGFSAALACLINMEKVADTLGVPEDLAVSLTLHLDGGIAVQQADCLISQAAARLNELFSANE